MKRPACAGFFIADSAGVAAYCQFAPRWSLVGAIEWQKLDDEVTASPIVVDDGARTLFVTLNYAL